MSLDQQENVTTYNPERIPDVFHTTIVWFFILGAAYVVLGFVFFVVPALFLWNCVRNPFTKRREWLQLYISPDDDVVETHISAGKGKSEMDDELTIGDGIDGEKERRRRRHKEALRLQYTEERLKKKGFYTKNPDKRPIWAYLKKNPKLARRWMMRRILRMDICRSIYRTMERRK
jgi:hypothetical protein